MKKIVFMDIDGVLNNYVWIERMKHQLDVPTNHFDPECVERFNQIIRVTGADVVISTSWRIIYPRDELEKMLRHVGVEGAFIDETPRGTFDDSRYNEIQHWLRLNMYDGLYVILDDCVHKQEAMTDEHARRIITTSMMTGITKNHVDEAIRVLGEVSSGAEGS